MKDKIIEVLLEELSGYIEWESNKKVEIIADRILAIQMEEWIDAKQKPKPGVSVLACAQYKNNRFVIRARWIPKHFEEDHDNYQGDADYDEEKDMFYWPEGWYEWNEMEETHWMSTDLITHWMPLPEPPTK